MISRRLPGTTERESGDEAEMRALLFAINFGAATLVLDGCIICLIVCFYEGGSFATLGGLLLGMSPIDGLGLPIATEKKPPIARQVRLRVAD
jgi:hypothetical protein